MRLVMALMLMLLAACQPLPRPFADDRPPPESLSPRDSAGVVVNPIEGAPAPIGPKLAEAMAAALRDAEIPASTRGGNRGSFQLIAAAREEALPDGRSTIAIEWDLRSADGTSLGRHRQTLEQPTAAWHGGGEDVAKALARQAAPAIAKLLQDEAPPSPGGADIVVAIEPVEAPNDRSNTLGRAMGEVLRRGNIVIAEKRGSHETFVVTGKVEIAPPQSGQQQVKISWRVLRADGNELGQVNQENAVPAGSLDFGWGDVAYAVASAAAPGITAVIERARAADAGS